MDILDDPKIVQYQSKRFWSNVNIPNEVSCWIWKGSFLNSGYGQFSIKINKHNHNYSTHRFAYFLEYGKIPDNLFVLHRCDNRKCVNPNHLFLGTQNDNIQDMMKKGRGKASRFTPQDILEIRKLYDEKLLTITQIAKKFLADRTNINKIVYRKTWKHI